MPTFDPENKEHLDALWNRALPVTAKSVTGCFRCKYCFNGVKEARLVWYTDLDGKIYNLRFSHRPYWITNIFNEKKHLYEECWEEVWAKPNFTHMQDLIFVLTGRYIRTWIDNDIIAPQSEVDVKMRDYLLYIDNRMFVIGNYPKIWEKTPSPYGLRFRVMQRDNFRCQLCGKSAQDGATLEVDHKIPKSKGGLDTMENLWTLCLPCNQGKSNRDL